MKPPPKTPILPHVETPAGNCCGCLLGGIFVVILGMALPVLLPNCGYIPFLFGG